MVRVRGQAIGIVASVMFGCSSAGSGASDGGGGNAGSGAPGVLFAADIAHQAIGSFADLAPSAGSALTGRVMNVKSTGLGDTGLGPYLAYDATSDQLYATHGTSVIRIDNASLATGTVTPSLFAPLASVITPITLIQPMSLLLSLDQANHHLYAGGSDAYCNSFIVQIGVLSGDPGASQQPFALSNACVSAFAVDGQRGILYVGYTNTQPPDNSAFLATTGLSTVRYVDYRMSSLTVDPVRDRLYAAMPGAGGPTDGVYFMTAASTGEPSFPHHIPIPHAQFVTVDAASDRLYVGAYDKAYVINHASTLVDGDLPGDAVGALAPAGSSIAGFAFP